MSQLLLTNQQEDLDLYYFLVSSQVATNLLLATYTVYMIYDCTHLPPVPSVIEQKNELSKILNYSWILYAKLIINLMGKYQVNPLLQLL